MIKTKKARLASDNSQSPVIEDSISMLEQVEAAHKLDAIKDETDPAEAEMAA